MWGLSGEDYVGCLWVLNGASVGSCEASVGPKWGFCGVSVRPKWELYGV